MSLHHNASNIEEHFDFKIVDPQWPRDDEQKE